MGEKCFHGKCDKETRVEGGERERRRERGKGEKERKREGEREGGK